MISLKKLPDYRYSKQQIGSFEPLKDPKSEQLILHIGNTNEDIIKLINSNIFAPNNFRSYYAEKLLVSENKKIRKIIQRSQFYKEFLEKTNYKLTCRNAIEAYQNKNLFYDLTPICNINKNASKKTRFVKMREFFDVVLKTTNRIEYNYKAIVFNVDNLDPDDREGYLNFVCHVINKKVDYFLDYFKGMLFIFVSPSQKIFFKFTVSEETFKKKSIIVRRIRSLRSPEDMKLEEIDDGTTGTVIRSSTIGNRSSRFNKILTSEEEEKEVKKTQTKEKVEKDIGIKDTGREEDSELIEEINKTIEETTDELSKEGKLNDMTEEELMDILTNKEEFKKSLAQTQQNQLNGYHKMNAEQLKREQEKVSFMDVSFKDLEKNFKEKSITKEKISHGNIKSVVNEEILTSTLKEYDDTYMNKKFNKDIAKVLKAFNEDNDIGMYVKDIKIKPNNSDMSKQSLLEVTFKDDSNTTHNFKVNIPEVKDGKFMYINGSKKVIMKQLTFMPVVKLEPNRVQITTNYNKHFLVRFGQKFSEKLDYLKKLFVKYNIERIKNPGAKFSYKFGNSLKNNSKYIATAEFNDISNYLYNIDIDNYHLIFDLQYLNDMTDATKEKYDEKFTLLSTYNKKYYFCMGWIGSKDKLILSNLMDKMMYIYDGHEYTNMEQTLSSWMITQIQNHTDPKKLSKLTSARVKTNAKLTYSRIEIMNKNVPLVVLLGYELGLLNLLDRYEIEYEFNPKNRSIHLQDDIGKIKFKDGYLYYDTSKIRNTVLLSGLAVMDTDNINFVDMNEQEPYLDYFQDAFNSRNAAKGFHNTMTLMIDPITKDVLEELNMPTNVYDVLLYANTLLEDVSYTEPSDVNNFRVRGAEQIPAMLYKIYADAFKHYKDSKHAKNPVKVTVDPDILIKKLQELKTIEAYSSLNPTLEKSYKQISLISVMM